ncbi:MAG: hypothetical protein J1D85_00665 [Bacteroidales bacterium]|nr:hypothetical protein [Bacteroidales bacterium]
MRKSVLYLLVCCAILGVAACGQRGASSPAEDAPELLAAVPSDALSVGIFSRLDKGLGHMLDSSSLLHRPDYGRLARSKAVVALCDVGSLTPLVIVEAGRHGSDTSAAAAALLRQAPELGLSAELIELPQHNAVAVSPSPTVISIVRRHIVSESSILDAPCFDMVLEHLGGTDVVACRNSGALKLFDVELATFTRREAASFLKDACEWTVFSGEKMTPVFPSSEKYYCNFMSSVADGQSKLGSVLPSGVQLALDFPVASIQEWRRGYETWLDARVKLEQYNKRLSDLAKKTGKNPLNWEKEIGVREVAVLAAPGYRVNMIRVNKSVSRDGTVRANPYTGFAAALYGDAFNAADSCILYCGDWMLSGERQVLDTLNLGHGQPSGWPSRARAAVYTPGRRLYWTNQSIRIWNVNQ